MLTDGQASRATDLINEAHAPVAFAPAQDDSSVVLIAQHPSPFFLALVSPWIGIVNPSKAGRILADASWAAFFVTLILHLALATGLALFLFAWSATVGYRIHAQINGPAPVRYQFEEKTIWEVLVSWHDSYRFDVVDKILLLVPVILSSLSLLLAWVRWVDIHEGGSRARSLVRSWRVIISLAGVTILLPVITWSGHIAIAHTIERDVHEGAFDIRVSIALNFLTGVAEVASALLIVFLAGRALRSARAGVPTAELAGRCESCGYDLSHQLSDSVCPECARPVALSIVRGAARNPGKFERYDGSPTIWLETSLRVLLSPTAYYSSIEAKSPGHRAERFRAWHYTAIGLGAFVWIVIVGLFTGQSLLFVCIATAGALVLSLLGWTVQHIIAALNYTWYLLRGFMPDPRYMRKVLAYETVYLWLFCLFNGTFLSSVFAFDDWITQSVGVEFTRRLLGVPPEVAIMFAGNTILCLLWFWRYHIAVKAIRWANF